MTNRIDGKYRVITELGRGGMGTAYLAAMTGPAAFRKLAVIKQLHPQLVSEPELVRMFIEEARLAARIDHPHVVQTFEVRVHGNEPYIAMEYIDGFSLERLVKRGRELGTGLPLPIHLTVLMHTLDGLHFAHELTDFDGKPFSLVHRDVSPHNVMVSAQGHAKLVDFGVAKATTSNGGTRSGVAKGKSAYMPLEQFEGLVVDRRADVFAVGVMLWQALTGERLLANKNEPEIYRLLLEGMPKPSAVKADVDPDLEVVCMRALAKRRDDRYVTAAAMLADLELIVAQKPELRASPRDVSTWVEKSFREERARIREAVEAAFADIANAETEAAEVPPTSDRGQPPPSRAVAVPSLPARRRPAWMGYAVGAAVAVLAFVAARGARTRSAAAAEDDGNTRIEVRASDAAKVRLDGAPLEGVPARGMFRRDGTRHLLRVEAEGKEPYAEWISLDVARIVLDVSLRAIPAPPAKTEARRDEVPAPSVTASAPAPTVSAKAASKSAPLVAAQLKPVASAPNKAPIEPAAPAAQPSSGIRVDLDPENPFKRGKP